MSESSLLRVAILIRQNVQKILNKRSYTPAFLFVTPRMIVLLLTITESGAQRPQWVMGIQFSEGHQGQTQGRAHYSEDPSGLEHATLD